MFCTCSCAAFSEIWNNMDRKPSCLLVTCNWGQIREPWDRQVFTIALIVIGVSLHIHSFIHLLAFGQSLSASLLCFFLYSYFMSYYVMLNSYVPTLRNMYGLRFGDRLLTLPVAILLYHNLKEETVVMFMEFCLIVSCSMSIGHSMHESHLYFCGDRGNETSHCLHERDALSLKMK